MNKGMMATRPIMVTIAVTSAISVLALWLLRKPKKGKPRFGQEIRDEEFLLSDDVFNCNHGSYGAVPNQVFRVRQGFLKEAESRPDEFMKLKSPIYYEEALLSIAEFVGANIENMVFVENTTTGINTVLKAMKFKKGESILINNLTHEAVSNTVVDVCDNPDLETTVVKLEIKLPIRSKEEIIQQYSDVLEDNPSVKVAVVDHITSSSAMVMPIKELIEVCKSKDVQVVIDGAQAIGQLQFNLGELGADYYIGNLHKWMFGVRGSAILWIHPKHYKSIKPLITGHNYQQSLFNQFFNQGTRDSSAYFCAPAAIKFFEEIGGFDEITKYNTELLHWAMELLKESWKTESFPIPDNMRAPFMGIVALPETKKGPIMNTDARGIPQLVKSIYEKYKVYVVIVYHQERLWCRVSTHVHNTKRDYLKLKDAVLDMLNKC